MNDAGCIMNTPFQAVLQLKINAKTVLVHNIDTLEGLTSRCCEVWALLGGKQACHHIMMACLLNFAPPRKYHPAAGASSLTQSRTITFISLFFLVVDRLFYHHSFFSSGKTFLQLVPLVWRVTRGGAACSDVVKWSSLGHSLILGLFNFFNVTM